MTRHRPTRDNSAFVTSRDRRPLPSSKGRTSRSISYAVQAGLTGSMQDVDQAFFYFRPANASRGGLAASSSARARPAQNMLVLPSG